MSRLRALTAQFAPADRDAWTALAQKGLKGAGLDSLTREHDGQRTWPLYGPGDAAPVIVAKAPADRARPWDVRAVAVHPDPRTANSQILEDLRGGAGSVLLKVGREGVVISGQADLAITLADVMIDLAPVALDAGFAGAPMAEALGQLAKRAPRALLAFHLDPLSAFAGAGVSPGPVSAHVAHAAEVGARLAEPYPLASLFLATGRVVHEAGGSDVQELAVMAAAVAAYLRALNTVGMTAAEALARIVVGVSVDGAFLRGVAKVRAARLIWTQIASACASDLPARVEARGSRRVLAGVDTWTNLLRSSASAFAGAVGGADAVVLEPFTQPLGLPDTLARRQARNIQLVLMEEANLGRVQDPSRGAWFADAASHALAAEAWTAFQQIERDGGLASVLMSGAVASNVAATREAHQARLADGQDKLVGVNLYRDAGGTTPSVVAAARPAAQGLSDDLRLPGADDRCPPLTPITWAEPFQEARA